MSDPIDLFLASQSPRRRELLDQIGVRFALLNSEIDEQVKPGEAAEEYVLRMAREKAEAGLAMRPAGATQPVLGADTSVVIDGHILGKPRDREDGVAMLQRLAGRQHQVMSGVALCDEHGCETRLSITHVQFAPLTLAQCEGYWNTGEPADKAGGYGIQGVAAQFVERIDGSYSGVVGLPLYETAQLLARKGEGRE